MMKRGRLFFLCLIAITLAAGFVNGEEPSQLSLPVSQPEPQKEQEPAQAPAHEAEYEAGVDDVLDIMIIKPLEIATTVVVAPDGAITVPYIGNVRVKGRTLPDIQEEVQKRLADGFMEFPVVSVSLKQTRSRKFVIYGQVNRPGTYPIDGNMKLLRAITEAGGFIVPGSMGKVKLLRPKSPDSGESEVTEVEIKTLLDGVHQDLKVQANDTIVVSVDKFFVYGQVIRPGAYAVEENMSLQHAITVAGGFIESGSAGRLKLFRPDGEGKQSRVIESDVKSVLNGKYQDVTVQANDTIVVTLDKFFVSGQVARPGAYPAEEQMPLLHAVTLAGGFVESRATGKVKLLRPNPESGDALVIETDIDKLLGGAHQEVLVLAGDTIVVTQDNFYVYGEVARPGMYPLESGKTVLTAVSMAGGLTKFGAPTKVKVLTKNEQTKAFDTIKVNLNDVISGDSAADIKLKSGDIIVISESAF